MTPTEQLLYCVVRIVGKKGADEWTGTGFIIQVKVNDGRTCPILFTNRHVVNDAESLRFNMHRAISADDYRPSGFVDICEVAGGQITYPVDPDVDLAAIPIAGLFDNLVSKGLHPYYKSIGSDSFPSDSEWQDFDVLEDCIMVGCPNGLYDSTNNFAIFRKGVTASSLAIDYEGKKDFLLDIACFGGSSGSPIFTYNLSTKFNRETNRFELGGRGLRFVGVLYAGPTYLHEGRVIMRTPIVNLRTTMHLGFAVKATEVRKLVDKILADNGLKEADPAQEPMELQ